MGVAQTVVSRLERQHDMLLLTLRGYLEAAADHPCVGVTSNGPRRRTRSGLAGQVTVLRQAAVAELGCEFAAGVVEQLAGASGLLIAGRGVVGEPAG